MCTVTFIPHEKGLLITSSRDEQLMRPAARVPNWYRHGDMQVLYPQDPQGGGTWFALNENGAAGILLNGAFEKHISRPPYRMSRGLLLPVLLSEPDPKAGISRLDLSGIEPFTLLLYQNRMLHVYRWDAQALHHQVPDMRKAHIWSSTTLYDPSMVREREQWFSDWLTEKPVRTLESAFSFHREAGNGNPEYSVQMNRQGVLRTVSITGLELLPGKALLRYLDTINGNLHEEFCHLSGTLSAV